MCVVSNIMDYGRGIFPQQIPQQPQLWPQPNIAPSAPSLPSPEEMRKWIESFRKLVAAGEEFDRITGQPDCVDPEKAELIERLADLESRIAQLEGVDKPE